MHQIITSIIMYMDWCASPRSHYNWTWWIWNYIWLFIKIFEVYMHIVCHFIRSNFSLCHAFKFANYLFNYLNYWIIFHFNIYVIIYQNIWRLYAHCVSFHPIQFQFMPRFQLCKYSQSNLRPIFNVQEFSRILNGIL